ncbi:MAG: nucleotidyltransferase family protein [bacterium]
MRVADQILFGALATVSNTDSPLSNNDKKALKKHHLWFEYIGQNGQITSDYQDNLKRNLSLVALSMRVNKLLEENNVVHIFLKGPVLSAQSGQKLPCREMKDIDLYIRPEDVIFVEKLITKKLKAKLIGDYGVAELLKWNHEAVFIIDGLILEVHWRASPSVFTFPQWDLMSMPRTNQKIESSQVSLPTFGFIDNFVYITYHGGKHQWYRQCWLLDWYRLLEKIDEVDRLEVLRKLRLAKQNHLFAAALVLMEEGGAVDGWFELLERKEINKGKKLAGKVRDRWQEVDRKERDVRQSALESLLWTLGFQPEYRQKIGLIIYHLKASFSKRWVKLAKMSH